MIDLESIKVYDTTGNVIDISKTKNLVAIKRKKKLGFYLQQSFTSVCQISCPTKFRIGREYKTRK